MGDIGVYLLEDIRVGTMYSKGMGFFLSDEPNISLFVLLVCGGSSLNITTIVYSQSKW